MHRLPDTLGAWLSLLEDRHPRAIDLGLERCREVWQRLGRPQPAPKIFVVAGTNGKGSTVATICAVLEGLGMTQGSYTTPHLMRYNERIHVNGKAVSDRALLDAFARVEAARREVSLTYFEFGTLAACVILREAELDFAVMEVGLGGRLDAVNLLDADCAVITPIGLDHQDYLGDDLESIAREKAGIIRPARPVVSGEASPPASIIECASANGAMLVRLGREFSIERRGKNVLFTKGDRKLTLPPPALAGKHQLSNMATGIAAVLELLPDADGDSIAQGIGQVVLPGRLQRMSARPAVWIDVGHNAMAAEAVSAAVRKFMSTEGLRRCRCVLGMLADKDAPSVAAVLGKVVDQWYCAGVRGDRGRTGRQLAKDLGKTDGSLDIRVFDRIGTALSAALEDSAANDAVLVFGSFLTASEALAHFHQPGEGCAA